MQNRKAKLGVLVASSKSRQHKVPQIVLVSEREVQVAKIKLPEGDLHQHKLPDPA